ncbi:glycosyltransferase family 32 protein [Marinomonas spartinae]|uniref:glycosyltransferase family 32 protein n=1 Tax=Marinomonas spartinae TaxID=1792290 RepID=UPI0018F226E5|nr:glycosyltransferase [Marinomonas spartinae]MBJ7553661.1 glycosyl transferase [Marinomonas spartinae]
MSSLFKVIFNRCIRLVGNLVKVVSYLFHFLLPYCRFTIPANSPAKIASHCDTSIPRIIWQTNYSNRCALPIYVNYLFNRLMSLEYEYRYVSTQEREVFMRDHAPQEVYKAYLRLNDGAAQADLWRVTCLYLHGGVYMDIDAVLVWPLGKTLKYDDDALYIKFKKDYSEFTNYFLATVPKNPDYHAILSKIVYNINHHSELVNKRVYDTTGPSAFNEVLQGKSVNAKKRGHVCIQGAFTNEYFQYLDKPRGKWTYLRDDEVVKKSS